MVHLVPHGIHHVRSVVLDEHVALPHSGQLFQEFFVVYLGLIGVCRDNLKGLGGLKSGFGDIEDDVNEVIFADASLLGGVLGSELSFKLAHQASISRDLHHGLLSLVVPLLVFSNHTLI